MMPGLTMVDSREAPASRCTVCGNEIEAGGGLTAWYGGRLLRFKCPGCLARFEADPDRYLAGHEAGCRGHYDEASPAREWRCD